jgi:hypothetical protein
MKLKSLLLGSAAALVAFSGARAADAVIAEPEPVEYVRVCDAYGAGYFYIPGTETCLKIGGFVRYQIDGTFGNRGTRTSLSPFGAVNGPLVVGAKRLNHTTQANITFSAKSDTDLGALEGFLELTTANGGAAVMDAAYISLGGLKMGWYDNAFDGGIVGEVDGLGGSKGNNIGYTFASGGFDATVTLDDEGAGGTNYVPNVAANAGFSAGAFAVRAFVAYDDKDGAGDKSNWAAKLRVGADVTEGGRLEVAGVYSSDVRNYSFNAANWSLAAAYQQKVSDTITVGVGAQYWNEVSKAVLNSVGATGNGGLVTGDGYVNGSSAWALGANVDWTPVTNFLVRAQVNYFTANRGSGVAPNNKGDRIDARLRFQRSF